VRALRDHRNVGRVCRFLLALLTVVTVVTTSLWTASTFTVSAANAPQRAKKSDLLDVARAPLGDHVAVRRAAAPAPPRVTVRTDRDASAFGAAVIARAELQSVERASLSHRAASRVRGAPSRTRARLMVFLN
jgi:hypothetical protein